MFSVKYVLSNPKPNVKFIVPSEFIDEIGALASNQFYIDSLNLFGYKYLGISNIGIIKVFDSKALSIKNYNPNELDLFKSDLH